MRWLVDISGDGKGNRASFFLFDEFLGRRYYRIHNIEPFVLNGRGYERSWPPAVSGIEDLFLPVVFGSIVAGH
jgi:hypothetical protein